MKTSEGQLLPLLEGENGKIEFMAGDVRARENPGLSSLHTIFVREHNRIATLIAAKIPQWSDECIYQFTRRNENHNVGNWFLFESCGFCFQWCWAIMNQIFHLVKSTSWIASRIVIAEMQNIVYGQYLPTILGPETMRQYDLSIDQASTYDPETDPSITNAFATAAFRFGHSMIRNIVQLIDLVTAAVSTYRQEWKMEYC